MEEKLGEDVSLSLSRERELWQQQQLEKTKKKDKWALLEMKQRHVVVVLHPGKHTDA